LQLPGALRDHFFKVLTVVFDLSFELPLVQCALEACQDGAFLERFNEIVVRTAPHRSHTHVDIIHTGGDQKRHMRMEAAYFGEQLHTTDARHVEVGMTASNCWRCKVAKASWPLLAVVHWKAAAQDEGEKLASSRSSSTARTRTARL